MAGVLVVCLVGFASVQSLWAFIIRRPCLFVNALFAWHRATLCALTFRHPCLFVNVLWRIFLMRFGRSPSGILALPACAGSPTHTAAHKKRRPHPLGMVSLKISTIAAGASRCVASLHAPKVRFIVHAPKVRFMCRKAHLVLKPAGCRIAVVWVAASVHRQPFVPLHRATTLCGCLYASLHSDFVRPPSCILARPASCGFSHPHSSTKSEDGTLRVRLV